MSEKASASGAFGDVGMESTYNTGNKVEWEQNFVKYSTKLV